MDSQANEGMTIVSYCRGYLLSRFKPRKSSTPCLLKEHPYLLKKRLVGVDPQERILRRCCRQLLLRKQLLQLKHFRTQHIRQYFDTLNNMTRFSNQYTGTSGRNMEKKTCNDMVNITICNGENAMKWHRTKVQPTAAYNFRKSLNLRRVCRKVLMPSGDWIPTCTLKNCHTNIQSINSP